MRPTSLRNAALQGAGGDAVGPDEAAMVRETVCARCARREEALEAMVAHVSAFVQAEELETPC